MAHLACAGPHAGVRTIAMKDATIVLGGGGVWGVAWMTGLFHGLAEIGLDLRQAAAFIGTSAGSIVGAQLAHGQDLSALYHRQTDPGLQARISAPSASGWQELDALFGDDSPDHLTRAKRIGAAALAAHTVTYAQRRAELAGRIGLSEHTWPRKRLVVTAVDCETAALTTFDASSGVELIEAITASCAVPCVWPVTPIQGRHYMDGGVWKTPENAQLAQGAARVVVVAPLGALESSAKDFAADVASLRAAGTHVLCVTPDGSSLAAQASGLLDPSSCKPAAEAGRAQASAVAEQLRVMFG